jgi:anti-anti-sigma factor
MTQDKSATPLDLAITANRRAQCATVVIGGNVDQATAPDLETSLGRLRALGCRRLTLDVRAVAFVDSTGLAVLFHAAKAARHHGDEVILRGANHRLLQLLDITRLGLAFSIEPSVDQVA